MQGIDRYTIGVMLDYSCHVFEGDFEFINKLKARLPSVTVAGDVLHLRKESFKGLDYFR